ncbi:MAG TPA: hypothetical protein ENI44_04335, partial [Thermoplasmatales archaeon]|nr:hypothetical protein [Thermoplasmatales archaeon]
MESRLRGRSKVNIIMLATLLGSIIVSAEGQYSKDLEVNLLDIDSFQIQHIEGVERSSPVENGINGETSLVKQSFNPFAGYIKAYYSDEKKGLRVYEDCWNVHKRIDKISWWGIPM